ncbi:MAG: HAMP domain-containing sensor histidine kinase, partial [Spirulinaceae cyanobacterium]
HLLTRAIRYALQRQQIFLELDQRVEQRTAELQKAVEELQAKDAQLQEALTAERKLSELKSRIISTISHEYRTPLTVINSAAELLQVYRHKLNEEKQSKYFHRIQKAVQSLTALVNDVLFINQAEFEKLKFSPQAVDLVAFSREIVEEMQPNSSTSSRIEFVHQGEGDCQDFYADTKLLGQLITNLLSNALKYSPEGGLVSLQLVGEPTQVTLKVTDQGIGIPSEDQANLFSSFHRASNVGTIQGTGLGLSIAQKCVELHEGEINVESEVGVGTTFTVHLPKQGKIRSINKSKKMLSPSLVG